MAKDRPYFELEAPKDANSAEELNRYYEQNKKLNEDKYESQQREITELEAEQTAENTSTDLKELKLKVAKYLANINVCDKSLAALRSNPEQFATLDFFKERIGEDPDVAKAILDLDNEPFKLSIALKSGVNLEVSDGKVYLDSEEMDAQKMHDTIAFLGQHGLVENSENLEIKDADEQVQACFDEAQEQFEEESYGGSQIFGMTEDGGEIPPEELQQLSEAEMAAADSKQSGTINENSADDNNVGYQGFGAEPQTSATSEKKTDSKNNPLKAACDSIEGWCNKNKRRNYSYFMGSTLGWTTFTIYPGEDRNQNIKPVTKDKDGKIKVNYEFKVYARMRNGKLEICYSLPPGQKLTDDQADIIAGMFDDAGVKNIDFKTMSNANQAIMRTACAKKLLVPTSHKLDQERYDKMIDAAGKKNDPNSPKLYAYKKDLALQMARYLQNEKGIDWRNDKNKNNPSCRRIRWAIGAYELHPFRDLWEDFGLRAEYEKRLAAGSPGDPDCTDYENGAVKVIGSKMAVYSLFEMFNKNASKDVKHLLSPNCKELTGEEKDALRVFVNDTGLKLDTVVRDMPPASLLTIYGAMCKTQEEIVKTDLEKEYLNVARSNHENGSRDDPEEKAISRMFSRANTMINSLNDELSDCNLPQIYLAKKDTPKYNFAAAKEKAAQEGYKSKGRQYDAGASKVRYLDKNNGRND